MSKKRHRTPRPLNTGAGPRPRVERLEPRAYFSFALGSNLVVNGDAETGPGSATGNDAEPVPGWDAENGLTVVQYSAPGGTLAATDSGPGDRGANYFAGGPNTASSTAAQPIDVSGGAAQIDGGKLGFTLSGWLGGFDGQDDNATLTATFMDGSGHTLGSATIGPVLSADRGGASALEFRSTGGNLPAGTRAADLLLTMTRTAGAYDDASADDLSFVLGPTAAPTSGAADPAFAGGGNVSLAFASQSVAIGANGQVLLAGVGSGGAGGSTSAVLERLNADGSADPTFDSGGTVSDEADTGESFYGVVPEADGGAVAVGSDGGSILLARYRADGSPDAAFGTGGRAVVAVPGASDAAAYGVALDSAGNVVVCGSAGGQFLADRFTPTGAQDPAFNGGAPLLFGAAGDADALGKVALEGDGGIVAAGASAGSVVVARLTAGGAADSTFGTGGVLPVAGLAAPAPSAGLADHSEGLAIDSAGNLLVSNTTAGGDFGLARLTPGGATDTSFGASGLAIADFGGTDDADFVAVRPDAAQILVAGTTTAGGAGGNQIGVAAFTTAGQLDTTFADGGREVLDSGLAAGATASEARAAARQGAPGGAAGPDAEGIGSILQQVFAAAQPDGKLVVGAGQQGGSSPGATVRRLLTAAPAITPTPTALPAGKLRASVAASLPKSAIAGAKLNARATVTVTNPTGATVSGPVTVTIEVSQASSLDGATRLTGVTRKLSLKAGKSAKVAIKLSALPSVPDGTYILLASVKAPDNSVTGAAGPSLSIAAPFVATRVSAVRPLTASVAAGRKGGVSLTVTNSGNTAAAGTATLTVLASPAGDSGANAVTLATTPLKVKLKPSAAKAYRVKFTLPSSLAAGSYDLTASLAVSALGDNTASDGTAAGTQPLVVT